MRVFALGLALVVAGSAGAQVPGSPTTVPGSELTIYLLTMGNGERIWERFVRLDRDIQSSVAGSGIGLAIVRELVVAQGGRCRVEDAAEGARFVVELPT